MASRIIKYGDEKYRCHAKLKEVQDLSERCNLRSVYQVIGVHRETGELAVDSVIHQCSRQGAMDYMAGYFHSYEMLDAWPILDLVEDESCLRRRLKYQLSRRNECTDAEKYPHYHRALRERPRETIKRLRNLTNGGKS